MPGRPGIPYLFRHGFERCAVVARDHQPVAQRCQPQGVAAPDARPGARHQRPCAARRHCAAFHPAALRFGRAVLRTHRGAGGCLGLIPAFPVPGLGRVLPAPGLVSEVPVSGRRPALCRGPGRFAVPFTLLHVFHAYGSLASSSCILRGSPSQCLQHFMSTEYIRAMQ